MLSFKVSYEDTLRRFTFAAPPSWSALEDRIRTLFSISPSLGIKVFWKDEDGDEVLVDRDDEILDISAKGHLVKLWVVAREDKGKEPVNESAVWAELEERYARDLDETGRYVGETGIESSGAKKDKGKKPAVPLAGLEDRYTEWEFDLKEDLDVDETLYANEAGVGGTNEDCVDKTVCTEEDTSAIEKAHVKSNVDVDDHPQASIPEVGHSLIDIDVEAYSVADATTEQVKCLSPPPSEVLMSNVDSWDSDSSKQDTVSPPPPILERPFDLSPANLKAFAKCVRLGENPMELRASCQSLQSSASSSSTYWRASSPFDGSANTVRSNMQALESSPSWLSTYLREASTANGSANTGRPEENETEQIRVNPAPATSNAEIRFGCDTAMTSTRRARLADVDQTEEKPLSALPVVSNGVDVPSADRQQSVQVAEAPCPPVREHPQGPRHPEHPFGLHRRSTMQTSGAYAAGTRRRHSQLRHRMSLPSQPQHYWNFSYFPPPPPPPPPHPPVHHHSYATMPLPRPPNPPRFHPPSMPRPSPPPPRPPTLPGPFAPTEPIISTPIVERNNPQNQPTTYTAENLLTHLRQMRNMGFDDLLVSAEVLVECRGNIDDAVGILTGE
ncbi:uncharacterized protein SPPG_00872 [Spizellomyces punctatus DAOM BR117]|uniref:PB1 domain-containing protein n=1 Tax=Spizellomyces punctatus (strain DAOM BR117) TaxID=645134 RepID=A0A0L0HQJ5_SPIPD|nr:uncharacterized protein SPPG_00872 [Spizellomyces punctatus DAOM BR117]KND03382.1 hypothetical protein SPPG_00872 [Spizellomyces punctatus DAOM BR117]|eukprot:XP_016611421.1 hypothetical protein SPPG_00872 [Spizellomyces punctatus DAOM BR117]